jgi:hypothetical protein
MPADLTDGGLQKNVTEFRLKVGVKTQSSNGKKFARLLKKNSPDF